MPKIGKAPVVAAVVDVKEDVAEVDAAAAEVDEGTENDREDAAAEANKEEAVAGGVIAGTEVIVLAVVNAGAMVDMGGVEEDPNDRVRGFAVAAAPVKTDAAEAVAAAGETALPNPKEGWEVADFADPNEKPAAEEDDEEVVATTGRDKEAPADDEATKEFCGKDPPVPKENAPVEGVVKEEDEEARGDAEDEEENKDEKDGVDVVVTVAVAATPAVEGVVDEAKEAKEGAALIPGVATEEVSTGEADENDRAAAEAAEDEVPCSGEDAEEEDPKPNRGDDVPDPKPKLGLAVEKGEAAEEEEKVAEDKVEVPKSEAKRGLGEEEGAADDEEKEAEGKEKGFGADEKAAEVGAGKRLAVVVADVAAEEPRVEKPNRDGEEAVEEGVPREKPVAGDEAAEAKPKPEKVGEEEEAVVVVVEEEENKGEGGVEKEEENGDEEDAAGVWDRKEKPWDCEGVAEGKENDGEEDEEDDEEGGLKEKAMVSPAASPPGCLRVSVQLVRAFHVGSELLQRIECQKPKPVH
ncbi:hypothetical protein BHE74_00016926 [Ensete ventricosum]|nr:hypothetical protein BHE74_00016926 [Ensete ventricosum]